MDGITFLKKIMSERPTPIVMCSTLTEKGSKASLDALRFGAIDVVAKPKSDIKTSLPESSRILVNAIKVAAKANMAVIKPMPIAHISPIRNKFTADAMLDKGRKLGIRKAGSLIAIGASTGGTQALAAVLAALPSDTLPILIVQHMPEQFTQAFAKRLNEVSKVEVKEAEDNDALLPGLVLIAPGGKHMMLQVTQFGA
jgi:two-component system chemotaxis response regulator CheB